MSESNIAQLQARIKDSMTNTGDGSVIPLQPSMTPEPRRKTPPKDRRAAARRAKFRSKANGDRDAPRSAGLPPAVLVGAPPTAPAPAPVTAERLPKPRAGRAVDVAAFAAATALAGAAAFFSLITAGWLASRWRATAWIWRLVLVALVAGLAVINAAGVYAQLVAAHVGERGAATAALETQDSALAARIELAAHNVTDLDRRLGQIDSAIEEAAKRGKTNTAFAAIEGQRKARAVLAEERKREAGTLGSLAGRARHRGR
jgi:hypothetical protein